MGLDWYHWSQQEDVTMEVRALGDADPAGGRLTSKVPVLQTPLALPVQLSAGVSGWSGELGGDSGPARGARAPCPGRAGELDMRTARGKLIRMLMELTPLLFNFPPRRKIVLLKIGQVKEENLCNPEVIFGHSSSFFFLTH